MSDTSLVKFWPLIQSLVSDFLAIIEPHIEEAAIRHHIPIELYYYSELGLDLFSTGEFRKRDPFSNPQLFEKIFVTLNFKGWIEPRQDGSYEVTEEARQAARRIIQAGEEQLLPLATSTALDLQRLAMLLKRIVLANAAAPEPPEKWAVQKRFRIVGKDIPPILRIREYLMDLLAYRDDCHLAASHSYFGRAGIIWSVLGSLSRNGQVTGGQVAESHAFRGYDAGDYEVALEAAAQIGWAEATGVPGAYRITPLGQEIHEDAQRTTNQYFYNPWSVMTEAELEELYDLLGMLREQLRAFRKRGQVV